MPSTCRTVCLLAAPARSRSYPRWRAPTNSTRGPFSSTRSYPSSHPPSCADPRVRGVATRAFARATEVGLTTAPRSSRGRRRTLTRLPKPNSERPLAAVHSTRVACTDYKCRWTRRTPKSRRALSSSATHTTTCTAGSATRHTCSLGIPTCAPPVIKSSRCR